MKNYGIINIDFEKVKQMQQVSKHNFNSFNSAISAIEAISAFVSSCEDHKDMNAVPGENL